MSLFSIFCNAFAKNTKKNEKISKAKIKQKQQFSEFSKEPVFFSRCVIAVKYLRQAKLFISAKNSTGGNVSSLHDYFHFTELHFSDFFLLGLDCHVILDPRPLR